MIKAWFTKFIKVLPKFFKRHRLIRTLLNLGWIEPIVDFKFNSSSRAMIDLRDVEGRKVFITREFELDYFNIAKFFIEKGEVIFDIGANMGLCTFGLASQARTQKCFYLFEANQGLKNLLKKSSEFYFQHKFYIECGCVTNEPGYSSFEISNDSTVGACSRDEGGDVPNIVLDDYVIRHGIERVHFAKMDIEGYEPNALDGWENFLKQGNLEVLYIEICAGLLKKNGGTPSTLVAQMESYGFHCFYCKEPELGQIQKNKSLCRNLEINGANISLAVCNHDKINPDFQSDILAFPQNSPWMKKIKNVC